MGYFVLFVDQGRARLIEPRDDSGEDLFAAYLAYQESEEDFFEGLVDEVEENVEITELVVGPDCETGEDRVVFRTLYDGSRERVGQILQVNGVDEFVSDDNPNSMPVVLAHHVYNYDEQVRLLGAAFDLHASTLPNCVNENNFIARMFGFRGLGASIPISIPDDSDGSEVTPASILSLGNFGVSRSELGISNYMLLGPDSMNLGGFFSSSGTWDSDSSEESISNSGGSDSYSEFGIFSINPSSSLGPDSSLLTGIRIADQNTLNRVRDAVEGDAGVPDADAE